jgi:hypothetical protein
MLTDLNYYLIAIDLSYVTVRLTWIKNKWNETQHLYHTYEKYSKMFVLYLFAIWWSGKELSSSALKWSGNKKKMETS